ncbi:MAG: hypothetical protein ABFC88_00275, partial [Thermoguttaceae bacterium]
MKRIVKVAVAASVVFALGVAVVWLTLGGSSGNLAFADVAKVFESLRSATFDVRTEVRKKKEDKPLVATGKGYFLAPGRQRIETSMRFDQQPAVKAAEEAARRMHKKDGPAAANRAAQEAAQAMGKAVGSQPETT